MSPDLPEALLVALRLIDQLEHMGIRYHIGGSYASSIHGTPRQTSAREAAGSNGTFNLIHVASAIKISAEDILLRKLQWYRLGGEVSDRQRSDVLGIVRTQGDRLDREYLRQWAPYLRVNDLLERALESG